MGGRWLNRHKNWLREEESQTRGEQLVEPEDYGVPFYPLKCPGCKSKNVRCYSTHLPIRYHVCRDCGKNFKSVEVEEK
jgi:transposase-like protein